MEWVRATVCVLHTGHVFVLAREEIPSHVAAVHWPARYFNYFCIRTTVHVLCSKYVWLWPSKLHRMYFTCLHPHAEVSTFTAFDTDNR